MYDVKRENSQNLIVLQVPDSDGEDVREAVEAGKRAFPLWKRKTALERSKVWAAIMLVAPVLTMFRS